VISSLPRLVLLTTAPYSDRLPPLYHKATAPLSDRLAANQKAPVNPTGAF